MSNQSLKSKITYFERRKEDVIAYQTEEEIQRALIEVVVFTVFLIVTTILALNCQNIYGFYANDSFQRLFIEGNTEKFIWEISDVTDIESWYHYVSQVFLGNLNGILEIPNVASNKTTDPLGLHSKPRFWSLNIVLHPPTLRQIRVKPQKCREIPFLESNRTCYGKYSTSDQLTEPEFKGTKYMDFAKSDIQSTWATIGFYSGGGYLVSIPYHKTDIILNSLQETKWIDGGTRLVVLSLETFNYNLGLFSSIKLISELLPTGNVVCAFHTTVVPLDSIWSRNNPFIIITACIFYLIVTFNLGNEIYEIITFGFRQYIDVIWNYIDFGVITCAYISLGFSIAHSFRTDKFLRDIENENVLASLDTLVLYHYIYVGTMSLCTFQLWIRIFRFITFNATMLHFNMALRRCAPEIFGFALILIVSFTIFSLIGLLGFGERHPDFSNFINSFFFMFRLMLHDFDYQYFSDVDRFWGPIYLMCYVLIVVFILVNMFLAIISQTYIDVKQGAEAPPIAIKTFLIDFYNKIKNSVKHVFRVLRAPTPKNLAAESTPKKIQFAEEPVISTAPTDTDSSSIIQYSEDQALQDYFGIEPSASITSLVEPDQAVEFEEEVTGEAKRETTFEFLARLETRLDLLESGFTLLENDIDNLLARFEGKARKTPPISKTD